MGEEEENIMKKIVFAISGLALCSGAFAVMFETESNNSIALANTMSRPAGPFAELVLASLATGGGDVDFFKVHLSAGETITAITTPMATQFTAPDTVLAIMNGAGTILVSNDDAGSGFGSAVRYGVTTTADYYIAVGGFPDFTFSGATTEEGDYYLTVGVVPEPASIAALGLGLAAFARRRAKK